MVITQIGLHGVGATKHVVILYVCEIVYVAIHRQKMEASLVQHKVWGMTLMLKLVIHHVALVSIYFLF